ncbi:RluA family pseudouridine synthase [Macrococcus lamae]|uniref:Pseudouridine synthase n=1 Tax=Macrococcus lamae TaxID=198484 RepID=A0A4R6BS75_9STAP|nr:RluA family pseudouridine synthase [Macrococcus lamae]TDM05203.1 RluA family pseudouridine synthase [Macrococcus lamae]
MTKNNDSWHVHEPHELLKFLFEKMTDRSKKYVRTVLSRGQVFVNGESTSQYNTTLQPGDTVEIRTSAPNKKIKIPGLVILHEDEHLIVINKEAGLLSIASDKDNEKTAYRLLSDYVKNAHPQHRIYVVHRLDRETSGVMVYAKTKSVQQVMQNNWKGLVNERTYTALVEGRVKQSGTITSWLTEDRTLTMQSSKTPNNGKKAVTHYEVLNTNRTQTLLKVNLETGRKNQIRIHMKELGHPIVGDKKYGAVTNPFRRIGLHASVLTFTHPVTKKLMRFEAELPKVFQMTFKSK